MYCTHDYLIYQHACGQVVFRSCVVLGGLILPLSDNVQLSLDFNYSYKHHKLKVSVLCPIAILCPTKSLDCYTDLIIILLLHIIIYIPQSQMHTLSI